MLKYARGPAKWQRRLMAAGAAGALGVGGVAFAAPAGAQGTTTTTTAKSSSPYLFVTNFQSTGKKTPGSVGVYTKPGSLVTTIEGSNTGLNGPDGIAIGPGGNLWVANSANSQSGASITEYRIPTGGQAVDNAKPIATIKGKDSGLNTPSGIAFDTDGNLFVANYFGENITEYSAAELAAAASNEDQKPTATISGNSLNGPNGITINSQNELFVTNAGNPWHKNNGKQFVYNAITEYKLSNGKYGLANTIQGSNTGLQEPAGISLTSAGGLIVSNDGNGYVSNGKNHPSTERASITSYGPGATGNAAPTSTTYESNSADPLMQALGSDGTLYVANYGSGNIGEYATNSGKVGKAGTPIKDGNGPSAVTTTDNTPPKPPPPPPPPAQNLASGPQYGLNQTDLFGVDNNGTVQVRWAEGNTGKFTGPLAISSTGWAPANAPVATANQAGISNQTDVFTVGKDGAIYVMWVQGAGHWHAPMRISPTGVAAPGGHLAAHHQPGPEPQTDVFYVGKDGAIHVIWVDGAGHWHGPAAITGPVASPGAPLASSYQYGLSNQTDVFFVNQNGGVQVTWVEGFGKWQDPIHIAADGTLETGASLATSNQFGIPNQTDVFAVDRNGAIQVMWVQSAGKWHGPMAISPKNETTSGADLAAGNQAGIENQTDVLFNAIGGATDVVWVDGAGKWHAPMATSPTNSVIPGSSVTEAHQGSQRTDVFRNGNSSLEQLYVDGAGRWHGPISI